MVAVHRGQRHGIAGTHDQVLLSLDATTRQAHHLGTLFPRGSPIRKIAAAIVFAVLTIVAGAAHATMLTATGGSIGVDPYVYEPGGTISGTDWALFGWSGSSCCVFGGTPVFMSLHVATLTVGTTTYAAACCDNNSFFTVTQPELGNCEISDCPPFTAPFTIAGHVKSGGWLRRERLGHAL